MFFILIVKGVDEAGKRRSLNQTLDSTTESAIEASLPSKDPTSPNPSNPPDPFNPIIDPVDTNVIHTTATSSTSNHTSNLLTAEGDTLSAPSEEKTNEPSTEPSTEPSNEPSSSTLEPNVCLLTINNIHLVHIINMCRFQRPLLVELLSQLLNHLMLPMSLRVLHQQVRKARIDLMRVT